MVVVIIIAVAVVELVVEGSNVVAGLIRWDWNDL